MKKNELVMIYSEIKLKVNKEIKEIKKLYQAKRNENKIFLVLSSCKEFIDFIKVLIKNQKLSIKKSIESQITIEFTVDYLYKQYLIKIDLLQKAINFELIALDLYKKISILNKSFKNLENNYKLIKEENQDIKKENMNKKKRKKKHKKKKFEYKR